MKTNLILVGKTVNKHFVAGINDYSERIGHYMPFDIITIPELKNTKNLTEEQQKKAEMSMARSSGASRWRPGWNRCRTRHADWCL